MIWLPPPPFDLLVRFIEYLNSLNERTVIIVEGKNDTKALVEIGVSLVSGKLITLSGMSLDEVVDLVYLEPKIILLVDFDPEGKRIRQKLKHEIQRRKGHGKIDPYPRQLLYQFFRSTRINEIEELKQFQFDLQGKLFDLKKI